jgi:starch synthase
MVRALQRAVEAFADKDRWRAMMKAGMASDFSWDRSAGEYIRVFERAIKARRGEA